MWILVLSCLVFLFGQVEAYAKETESGIIKMEIIFIQFVV